MTDGVKFEMAEEDITWLFELKDDFETYWVGYELRAEELIVSDYESSKWLLESWGDADLEHYVHIKREHVPAFIAACSKIYNVTPASDPTDDEEIKRVLHEAFTGRRRMIFEVKDILKDNDLPYRFDMW